eukprot:TRINITY_DN20284_c1_g1_i2.p1 TRINITY_DN20284_c1_g1~~TRINITY_DN20284_c1_g1_i2.p1  ORF type:complete len:212 (-),score=-10.72 TRINITY_DN20284_c1_g1_i2:58-693(-)
MQIITNSAKVAKLLLINVALAVNNIMTATVMLPFTIPILFNTNNKQKQKQKKPCHPPQEFLQKLLLFSKSSVQSYDKSLKTGQKLRFPIQYLFRCRRFISACSKLKNLINSNIGTKTFIYVKLQIVFVLIYVLNNLSRSIVCKQHSEMCQLQRKFQSIRTDKQKWNLKSVSKNQNFWQISNISKTIQSNQFFKYASESYQCNFYFKKISKY